MKIIKTNRCLKRDEDDEILNELSELCRIFILPSYKFPAKLYLDFDGRRVDSIEEQLSRIEKNLNAFQLKVTQARNHFNKVRSIAKQKQELLENNKILK